MSSLWGTGVRMRRMAGIRTYHHEAFDPETLALAKDGRVISVIIPARDEETTIGGIVVAIRRQLVATFALVDEILVVDDRSTDRTRARAVAAGARVVGSNDVLVEYGPARGKGGALWKGVAAATGDVLAFVDGDVADFDPRFVVGLLGPLLTPADSEVAFVKGFYERPLNGAARGGGRVTELAARPIVSILLDHLAGIIQPLAGEFAAPRTTLERLPFVEGYGVDIGLLADAAATFGVDAVVQVDLGRRVHRNRPIHELGPMSTEVLLAVLSRAGDRRADDRTARRARAPCGRHPRRTPAPRRGRAVSRASPSRCVTLKAWRDPTLPRCCCA